MHDMSNTRKEIAARLGFAAGNGAKTRMDRSDGNYFLITAMVDNAPTGERSFDTKAEAEYYGKQMLEATKKANPKAKSVKVSLMEVVNMSPQAPFKTLSSRPGAKTRMTREQTEEQKAGLKLMSAADPAVGAKIAKLIKEGKPQDQAVAIALDMKRRGEL